MSLVGFEPGMYVRFIISASPLDGTVDIYSIWDQKLVQSLTLPEPVMALGASPAVVEDATVEDTDREKVRPYDGNGRCVLCVIINWKKCGIVVWSSCLCGWSWGKGCFYRIHYEFSSER